MFSRLTKILFIFSLVYYLFHFLFFWIFESTDSYFYWAFAEFMKTGKYFAPSPYFYTVPSTMEPPLYSVFLYLAQILPRADIIIHLVQVLAIIISSLLIYKILKKYTLSLIPPPRGSTSHTSPSVSSGFALLLATTFLLTPAHTIYISNLVAEPMAVFFIVFYVYMVHLILNEKKTKLLSWLLILSSVMVLHRYNLIVFYGFALGLIISRFLVPPPRGSTSHTPEVSLGFLISIVILFSWVIINNRLNGSWGLSNAEGKHLYNRILHFDRLLPPSNDHSFIKFKSIVGENIDYFKPWWFYEPGLIAKLGSETEASKLMGEVAMAAFKTNPLKYILDTPIFFLFAHNSNPTYHDPLYLYSWKMKDGCRPLGNIEFCKPIINSSFAVVLWDKLVQAADYYYLNLSRFVNFFLLIPSIIFSLWKKNTFMRFIASLYLAAILFFVLAEAPIPRYTYIFTPIKTILIGNLIIFLLKYRVKKT